MIRALVIFCGLCVGGALLRKDTRTLDAFLPSAHEEPAEVEAPSSPGELERSLVQGKLESLVADALAFHAREGRLPEDIGELIGDYDVPIDPWDSAYELEADHDGTFLVRSLGPDTDLDTDDDLVAEGRLP